jgi:NHLM bacteriocin system ABC transporter ATP-binding protein
MQEFGVCPPQDIAAPAYIVPRPLQEDDRIARSARQAADARQRTWQLFARLFKPQGVAGQPQLDTDPLLAICRIAAASMGFTLPADAAAGSGYEVTMAERIGRITRSPVRELALSNTWWRQELGTLLVFTAGGAEPHAAIRTGRFYTLVAASGLGRRLTPDLAAMLTRSAFVLYPPLPDRTLSASGLFRFGLHGCAQGVASAGLAGLAGAVLALGAPIATGVLIDDFIPSHLKTQTLAIGAGLLLVAFTRFVLGIAGHLAALRLSGRVAGRLQPAIVDRILRLPPAVLAALSSADIGRRAMVVDAMRQALSMIAVDAVLSFLFAAASLLLIAAYARLAAFAALGLFAVFLCIALVSGWLEARTLVGQEEAAAIAADRSLQLVQCVDHLRSAGAEERAFAHWGIAMLRAGAASLRAGQIGSRFRGFAAAFELLGLILFFGVLNAGHTAGATTGDLATMIAAFAGFTASASGFCLGLRRVMLLKPKGVRAMVLVRAAPESGPDRRPPGAISGRIEINDLSFAYGFQPAPHERAGTPVLDSISLRIEPGEFIALVGASGCGKSTLVRLLLGFERPQRGGVFYDRQNLKDLDLRALRRQIGVMLQPGHFMPGSIAENILGATGGRLEDAWEAARLAGLAEDIEQMPMGMHTILTDGASGLSGGQTQRLLIARALASKPRILILDEATSALDNLTQAVVTENLEHMKLTRIVVAHRLSTIIKADRIYVLAGGHIVQSGSYQDLMAQPGVFAHLARRQDP